MAEWFPRVTAGLLQRLTDNELSLTALTLEVDNPISQREAGQLGDALKGNKVTHTLSMEWTGLGPDGMKKLAAGIARNKALTSVNLCSNSLGPVGASHLASILTSNYTLRDLDVSRNNLGANGMKKLAAGLAPNMTLRRLNVSHNNLGAKGGTQLGWLLKRNVALENLSAAGNSITDSGVKDIAISLQSNTGLKDLDLDFNELGADAAAMLGDALGVNSTLIKLSLAANELGVNGARCLSNALKSNSALKALDVSGHQLSGRVNIGPEGATVLLIGLSANESLTDLNLDINAVSSESMKEIASLLMSKKGESRTPEKLLKTLDTPLAKSVRKLFPDDEDDDYEVQLARPAPRPQRAAPARPSDPPLITRRSSTRKSSTSSNGSTGGVRESEKTPTKKSVTVQHAAVASLQENPDSDALADALDATLQRLSMVLGHGKTEEAPAPAPAPAANEEAGFITPPPTRRAGDDSSSSSPTWTASPKHRPAPTYQTSTATSESVVAKFQRKLSDSMQAAKDTMTEEEDDEDTVEEAEEVEAEQEDTPEDLQEEQVMDMETISIAPTDDEYAETLDSPAIVVNSLTAALQRKGLDEEGLFRISGAEEEIEEILDQFYKGKDPLESSEGIKKYDVHAMACALKRYLRTMQPAALPAELFFELVNIGYMSDDAERVEALQQLVEDDIDYADRLMLRSLGRFLAEVAERSSKNKMNTANLAVVFVPAMIRAPSDADPQEVLGANKALRVVVETLIQNARKIL